MNAFVQDPVLPRHEQLRAVAALLASVAGMTTLVEVAVDFA